MPSANTGRAPYRETRNYIRRVMSLMGLSAPDSPTARPRTKIYKYTTSDGKTIITDTLPAEIGSGVEVIH